MSADQHFAEMSALCDMCEHPEHYDTDCGEVTGYDHLNGDHECGCPGSLTAQLARAWDEGYAAGNAFGYECAQDTYDGPSEDPTPNPYAAALATPTREDLP